MPAGMKVVYPYDTSPVVKASIEAVVHTLLEAIVLVVVVMFLFLQNIRATLIPTLAVPVVLLGTFGVLFACGFTINVLTMFAMVLAIGLLVDDAIVVVENVERVMAEEGLSPREATRKSMGQIQGALVGIAMVISAVFMPMAFFPGSAGVIYRQFSITIITVDEREVAMHVLGQRHGGDIGDLAAQLGGQRAHRLDAAVEHHLDRILDERVLERHGLGDERLVRAQ